MTSKVAFLGALLDGTGYSKASIGYVQSLLAAGVKVAARPIRMTNTYADVPPEVRATFDVDLNNVDAVIQHNLPSEWVYKSNFLNCGMFAYETSPFSDLTWTNNISLMDRVIVFCDAQKKALKETYGDRWPEIQEKVMVVPHAVDTSEFDKPIKPMDLGLPTSTLKLYGIGEFCKRKNWAALVLSYFSAFTSNDDVALIIKTSNGKAFKEMIEGLKDGCNRLASKVNYPPVIILPDRISEEQMKTLHVTGSIYVSTSYGESWNLPAADALLHGSMVIAPNSGAFKDYIKFGLGSLIPVSRSLCYPSGPGLYSSDQTWEVIDTEKLAQEMRAIYSDKNYRDFCLGPHARQKRKDYMRENFSFEVVGKKLLVALS